MWWLGGCKREGEREREREREGAGGGGEGGELLWTGSLQKRGFGPRDFFGFCASCDLIVSSQRRFLVVLSVMEGEGC